MLSSPLAGLSLDAVALIGLHARETRRDVWWTVSELNGLSGELPDRDRRRLERFVTLFEAERRSAPQVSLETLIHRAISETGYDRHVLSLPAGGRRMANVRKLMRMAREYEAEEGRDLRGFIDTLAERDAAQPREGEAPLEAEALDAVRLMTIHRAKGSSSPWVAWAIWARTDPRNTARASPKTQPRLAPGLVGGGAVDSTELERIKAQQKRVGEEEEKRIFYVAVTRAQQHLVLSGATDLESLPPAEDMKEPMRWMLPGFAGEGARRIDLRPGNEREQQSGQQVRCRTDLVLVGRVVHDRPAQRISPPLTEPHRIRCVDDRLLPLEAHAGLRLLQFGNERTMAKFKVN